MALPKQEFAISARDETKIAFDSVKNSIANIQNAGLGLNRTIGTLAPLLGAATFTSFLKGGIDTLDMLGDLRDRTGIAASTLSGFQLVAAQSDTSLEALGNGINKLSLFMANNAEQAKKLGLTASDPAEAFIQLAGVLEKASTVQERNAVANKVLGKSYAELLPALNQGAEALRAQLKEGQELAGVTDENVKQAQKFNDELDKLKLAGSQLSVTLGSNLVGSLNQVVGVMKEAAKEGGILKALFMGFGELGKVSLFGSDAENMKKRAEFGIPAEMAKLTERLKNDASGFKTLTNTERYAIGLEMKALANERNNLTKLLSEPESTDPKKTDTGNLLDLPKTGKSQAQRDAEAALKSAQSFTEKLQQQAATLGLSKTALLEYDAAQLKLNANQQATVQASIAKIDAYERELEAVKDLAEFEKLLQESDNRDLAQQEEQSQLEQQIQAAREADFEAFYNNLTRLNEDLNVELLTSDKKRAQAQIDLENARAIERINALNLEVDETNRLLELQEEAYQLQTKKVVQKGTSDFEQLTRAVRGFGDDARDVIVDFAFGAETSISGLVDSILKDFARLALQKQLIDPLLESFSGALGSTDGPLSGLKSLFGGFFAEGGRPPLNKISVVGERGPELFVPDGAGTVIPNRALGGSQYNVVVNVDATGGNVSGNAPQANELGRQIEGAVRGVLLKEKRPGGILANA